MKKINRKFLAALTLVFGMIFAACDSPTNGAESNDNGDTTNINFGDITATSTQEEVTNTIKLSLELLQSQTQNIINKMTEYKTELQQKLDTAGPLTDIDALLNKIEVITNIINYENQIKSAQQNRNTSTGRQNMNSYYNSITEEIAKLLSGQADKNILIAKTSTYRGAVELDERNIITSAARTTALDVIKTDRSRVINLERANGNVGYSLPNPETDMYGLRWQLENENKQKLSDSNVLGQYGQYIFYQGQDISEYSALLFDAATAGKETTLPRSVAQRSLDIAGIVNEINAQAEVGR
jgi:hypothetical protein